MPSVPAVWLAHPLPQPPATRHRLAIRPLAPHPPPRPALGRYQASRVPSRPAPQRPTAHFQPIRESAVPVTAGFPSLPCRRTVPSPAVISRGDDPPYPPMSTPTGLIAKTAILSGPPTRTNTRETTNYLPGTTPRPPDVHADGPDCKNRDPIRPADADEDLSGDDLPDPPMSMRTGLIAKTAILSGPPTRTKISSAVPRRRSAAPCARSRASATPRSPASSPASPTPACATSGTAPESPARSRNAWSSSAPSTPSTPPPPTPQNRLTQQPHLPSRAVVAAGRL